MNAITNSTTTIWSFNDHPGTSIFNHTDGFRVIVDPIKHGFNNIVEVIRSSSFLKQKPNSFSNETNSVFFELKSDAIKFYLSWR